MIMTRTLRIAGMLITVIVACIALRHAFDNDKHVDFVNMSHLAVIGVFVSDAGSSARENDILGWNVLPPGYHVSVNLDEGNGRCRFDFKLLLSDGRTLINRNFDVCAHGDYTVKD